MVPGPEDQGPGTAMLVYRIFKRDPKEASRFYYDARSKSTEQSTSADG